MDIRPLYSDQELLAKIAGGDQYAFRIIYDRYYHNLYAFALKVLKNDLLAEEIVQEVYLRIWKQGDSLAQINNIESYLVTIARNMCYDQLRRGKLRNHASLDEVSSHFEQHNETEETILLNDTRKIINEAVSKLPPQQRQVYQLCHQEGYKYDEAAKELNLSPATVKSYMKLALKNLRNQLGNHPDLAILIVILKLL